MERTVKLRVKGDYKTYQKLKEVEKECREVLTDAMNYWVVKQDHLLHQD